MKNSWGTYYPQDGFFWVSYDEGLISFEASLSGEPTREGESIYQKDTVGWMDSMAADPEGPNSTGYMANVFTSKRDERLDRVMLAATGKNASYEVSVYTNLANPDDPTSGTLASTASGTKAYPGYVTVSLDNPVTLAEGDVFSVVAKMTTPTFGYPIPVEVEYVYGDQNLVEATKYIGFDPETQWQTREVSWVSTDGAHWRDPYGNGQKLSYAEHSFVTNVTLKAITVPANGGTEPGPEIPPVIEPDPEVPPATDPDPEIPPVSDPDPNTPITPEPDPETPPVPEPDPDNPTVTDPDPEAPSVPDPNPEAPPASNPNSDSPTVEASTPSNSQPVGVNPSTGGGNGITTQASTGQISDSQTVQASNPESQAAATDASATDQEPNAVLADSTDAAQAMLDEEIPSEGDPEEGTALAETGTENTWLLVLAIVGGICIAAGAGIIAYGMHRHRRALPISDDMDTQ